MTAKYFAILTNQGAARLANAAALGTKLNLTQMAVGDANGVLPTPDPAQTKLINQKRIAPLNLLTVDPANTSQIIAEQIIPENEGGFWIREIGLYDDDGILIAVANCPETYKPELQEGSGRTQTIRMILIVSSTSAITLKIDPSVVLATRQYVDDKVIEVKSYADGLMRAHEQSRNHPDATTTAKGFTQLNSSVTDDRETQSATPKAVKIAMDNANARLAKERNLSDLPNPALARQNLQLGDSSTKNTGTTANTVAAGDDARITGAMQKSQNGADIQDVAKFLQNLGIPALLDSRQPINDMLTGFARLDGQPGNAANNIPYISGKNVVTTTPLTAFMRSMFGKADKAAVLSLLGVPELLDGRQPINDTLTAFAQLDGQPGNTADNIPYFSAHNTVITTALTAFMRSMFGKASAADVLALLGTKTAALRDVGTGANQIPDMSSFVFSNATQGFVKHPNGFMEQWFIATVPQAPSATVNGTIDVLFPNPFPNKCYGVNVNYAGITATRDGTPFLSGMVMDKFACRVASTYLNSGLDVFVRAVGY
ncbi:phage tail protein [Citrobacter portucalensis]|uniref:Phage tail protein n=1 Tax=Citrobacter portucalensis TaxID=1639133 RepID=A0AAW7LUK4_9ENTR|nr:phage tail protein [Citrobacter portucalensis]MDN4369413.1 phage tail protein [Citrobacter portucalensis]MDO1963389.1 phage tail protein [Escherichia coli]MDO1996000.1 phage tail protein [Escherichia coli]